MNFSFNTPLAYLARGILQLFCYRKQERGLNLQSVRRGSQPSKLRVGGPGMILNLFYSQISLASSRCHKHYAVVIHVFFSQTVYSNSNRAETDPFHSGFGLTHGFSLLFHTDKRFRVPYQHCKGRTFNQGSLLGVE